jgi:hypothetical protein
MTFLVRLPVMLNVVVVGVGIEPTLRALQTRANPSQLSDQKKQKSGLWLHVEAARSVQVSRFCFEIWEREAAPAELMPDWAIYRQTT